MPEPRLQEELPEAGPAPVDDRVRLIQETLQRHFIFRKLGLCYDYASSPEEFPRKTLPTSREARAGKPNPGGLGTGMAECTSNGALIFDGYLLRLELGIAHPEEERIFDRLIGGLIRAATTAPKGAMVRGLTPDGRGYYARCDWASHLFWAFSAWRASSTAAIAVESQAKVQNIASRWIQRLTRDAWKLPRVGEKEETGPGLDALDSHAGPQFLACIQVAAAITEEQEKWQALYAEKVAEGEGARIAASPAASAGTVADLKPLLQRQLAYHILHALEADEARKTLFAARLAETAQAAVPFIERYKDLKPPILEETPDLAWRSLSADGPGVKLGSDEEAFNLPVGWRRILHEAETVGASMLAAEILLLGGSAELAQPHAATMTECFQGVPWEQLWFASALAPAIGVHARGVEMGLWDEALLAPKMTGVNLVSVAQYLSPEYDEQHPAIAGHTQPPPSKQKQEKSGSRNRSRGRRRRRKRKR